MFFYLSFAFVNIFRRFVHMFLETIAKFIFFFAFMPLGGGLDIRDGARKSADERALHISPAARIL